jgi:sensor histidine kinase regulating citrate/malate metabolism
LPPVALFMRTRLKNYLEILGHTDHPRLELGFLVVVLVLYLVLNALYSALWIQLRDALRLSFVYFIPFSLFLSLLLIFTFYCTINLSVFKARSAQQSVELALMRQNYDHIEENIGQHKRALHDTRQLLRNISTLAKDGTREDLLKYIDEAMEYTTVSDTRFCANPCVNGLLNYYAGLSEAQGIGFSARAVCDRLPFSDADMTILLGNALDNALRAAAEFAKAYPDARPEIRFTADTINDQFAIQIENPCLAVSYAEDFPRRNKNWLSADAFASMHGSGYGLRCMEKIAGKYGGHAWFSFEAKNRIFVTRLMLPVGGV